MAAKKHPKTCAYCGTLSYEWDEDHPVPRCLWDGKPLPHGLIKVPSCIRCNNYWSIHEGYFRSMAALIASKGDHPVVKQMISGTVKHHFDRDQTFRRHVLESFQFEPLYSPTGLYVGNTVSVTMDWKRWLGVSAKIVRGLYFKDLQHPVPDDYMVQVYQGDGFWTDIHARKIVDQLPEKFSSFGLEGELDDVFMGKRAAITDDPKSFVYVFIFYKTVSMFAWVLPTKFAKYKDPSHPDQVAMEIAEREKLKRQRKATKSKK